MFEFLCPLRGRVWKSAGIGIFIQSQCLSFFAHQEAEFERDQALVVMLKANDTECSSGATMQNGKNAQVGWRSVLPLHRDRKPLFCGLQPGFRFAQLPTIGCWYLKKFDEIANIEGSIQSPQGQLTCPTIGTIQGWGRNGSPHGKHRRLLYRRHLWKHCH